MINSAIKTFDIWARKGKDEGMAMAHEPSVDEMLNFSLRGLNRDFKFIDGGCGNGWVVRKVKSSPYCKKAIGVDGSLSMINKAKQIDPKGEYLCADLLDWDPKEKVDLVHTMEVIYYFKDPMLLIEKIYDNWVLEGGRLICGVDYYFENTDSHSWQKDLGIPMTLFSNKQWSEIFNTVGFKEVKTWVSNSKSNQSGTLIITGVV